MTKQTINGKKYDIEPHVDLIGANLSRADLTGANLIGANSIHIIQMGGHLVVAMCH